MTGQMQTENDWKETQHQHGSCKEQEIVDWRSVHGYVIHRPWFYEKCVEVRGKVAFTGTWVREQYPLINL